ncbi:MAG: DUF4760 domain-containing protein [Thermoanaerobaculia bacterium]
MTSEFIGVLANIALALSFVVGLVFGVVQVRAAARDRRERLTIETLSAFQTREFAELMYRIVNSGTMPATGEELRTLPAPDQILFIELAQKMESLGILVAEGVIDIGLVDKTLGSFVSSAWEKYEPMFRDMREKNPDPFLGEYFQWLAERIDELMRKNPRRPFYEAGPPGSRSSR